MPLSKVKTGSITTSPTITTPTISSLSSASATALTLQSAGTTAITVDTSQNVGIGTTSPSSASGTSLAIYNASGQARLAFKNGVTGNASTDGFQVGIDGDGIALVEQRENLAMVFSTNATERMRINATAPVLCLAGGSTTATGTGITFPATQSASSDANTLDDYEEGTWTPTIILNGTSSGITYAFQTGRYTKVGNQVTIFMYIQLSNKGSSVGNLDIGGLPFASANISSFYTGGAIRMGATTGLVGASQFYCSPNQTTLAIEIVSNTRVTNTNIASSSDFSLNWSYMV
jgi:hypothetical protein